jgi:uncharacterized protein (TIRG00374 family)
MVRQNLRATALGVVAALALFGGLIWFAGVDRLFSTLRGADLSLVAVIVLATLCWITAWGLALRTVLDALGVAFSPLKSFFVFSAAMFSNNITPFGQAGGEPVTALLISETSGAEYETSLAAIASVDTLNFVPSITIALIGAGYFATQVALGANRNITVAIAAVVVLAVAVPTLLYAGWRSRDALERRVVAWLTPAIRRVSGVLPRVSAVSETVVRNRIEGFFDGIERITSKPRGLALALAFSALGWGCLMLALWTAFQAIGTPIPASVALFAVPIAAIAGVTPLPGGAGGIETVLVLLLVAAPLPTITTPIALAAVVIYRGIVYWTPTLIGGVVVSVLGVNRFELL